MVNMINESTGGIRKEAAVVAALVLAGAITVAPAPATAAVLAGAVAAACVVHPRVAAYMLVLSFSVSVQRLFMMNVGGFDTLSFYKFVMLGAIAVALLRYGLIRPLAAPAAAMALLAVQAYATWLVRGEPFGDLGPLKAFFGLVIPFLLLLPHWRVPTALRIRTLLMALAPASVAIGFLLQAAGVWSAFAVEFTGVPRLQGANIAAHLAMLAFIGAGAALCDICNGTPRPVSRYAFALVNLVIIVATGTRGPLLALAPLALVFVWQGVRNIGKGKPLYAMPIFALTGGGAAAILLQLDNYMLRQSEKGLSGRDTAWSFFLEQANETPLFGRGLGKVLEANDGTLFSGFTVPHNEFLRFYYDSGIIGAAALLLAFVWVFRAVAKTTRGDGKAAFLAFAAGVCVYSFTDNTLSTVQFAAPLCCFLNSVYIAGNSTDRRDANGGKDQNRHRRIVAEG